MSLNTFPTYPTISHQTAIRYPEDEYGDDSIVTQFEDRSVEVRNRHSTGKWEMLPVTIVCPEADADVIFTFLQGQRLKGIPFNFVHRKRGTVIVRYWSDRLPMKRVVSGSPDQIQFDLQLREE